MSMDMDAFCPCVLPHPHPHSRRLVALPVLRPTVSVLLPKATLPQPSRARGRAREGQGTAAALLLASSKEMRKEKQPTHPNLSSAAPLAVATRGSGLGSRELARPEPEVFEKLIPKNSQSKTRLFIRKKHPEISNLENAS